MLFCDGRWMCLFESSRVDIIKTHRLILTVWASALFGGITYTLSILYGGMVEVSLDVSLVMYLYTYSNNIYI